MELLLSILLIITTILICKNWDWILYMIKEERNPDYVDKEPPFCFECDAMKCEDCKAYKAWKINPNEGWKIWDEMKKRRSYKYK